MVWGDFTGGFGAGAAPFMNNGMMQTGYMDGYVNQLGYSPDGMGAMPVGYPNQMQYGAPMGYPAVGAYSGQVCYAPIKYSRQQMLDGLRNYVVMSGQVPISREEKIEETPQLLRHACAPCGVSFLQMLNFSIPEVGVNIPFYFCTACGKLYYYKDFYM